MANALRYASSSHLELSHNGKHEFAARYALSLFRANAVYSFIPKNACSTLRYSLALENGCIDSAAEINWIHKNNATFRADLRALASAAYSFVVLRCPFARLASAYLDKIVGREVPVWSLYDLIDRKTSPDKISFAAFVSILEQPGLLRADIHWRPQVDFLVYKEYGDVFQLERFGIAQQRLREACGFQVHDARGLTQHGIDGLERLSGGEDFSQVPPVEIFNLRQAGRVPQPAMLYNEQLVSRVAALYAEDLDLYKRHFGASELMFQV